MNTGMAAPAGAALLHTNTKENKAMANRKKTMAPASGADPGGPRVRSRPGPRGGPGTGRLPAAAVHAAARAAVLVRFGRRFARVYLRDPAGDRPEGEAVTPPAGAACPATRDRAFGDLVVAVAGYVAEAGYARGWHPRAALSPAGRTAGEVIRALAAVSAGDDRPGAPAVYLEHAKLVAVMILLKPWDAVLRLAGSLARQECGYLGFAEACRVLRARPRAGRPPASPSAAVRGRRPGKPAPAGAARRKEARPSPKRSGKH